MLHCEKYNNVQGSYVSGKSQGKNNIFKVRELSGNFGKCQGIFEICKKVMDLSGNFLMWLSASSFFFFKGSSFIFDKSVIVLFSLILKVQVYVHNTSNP